MSLSITDATIRQFEEALKQAYSTLYTYQEVLRESKTNPIKAKKFAKSDRASERLFSFLQNLRSLRSAIMKEFDDEDVLEYGSRKREKHHQRITKTMEKLDKEIEKYNMSYNQFMSQYRDIKDKHKQADELGKGLQKVKTYKTKHCESCHESYNNKTVQEHNKSKEHLKKKAIKRNLTK
jgi:uncharacterized protein YukE